MNKAKEARDGLGLLAVFVKFRQDYDVTHQRARPCPHYAYVYVVTCFFSGT